MEDHSNDDDEYFDYDDDPNDGYVPCPHCGETMLEAADHCPCCNHWITSEEPPVQRKSTWVFVTVVVLLAIIILSIVH